jgi:hypothetical protein
MNMQRVAEAFGWLGAILASPNVLAVHRGEFDPILLAVLDCRPSDVMDNLRAMAELPDAVREAVGERLKIVRHLRLARPA